MEDNLSNDINETNDEYIIISKNTDDILNDMDFENEEERILCESIITNLERTAATNIRNMNAVSIPYIGVLRINLVKRKFATSKLHLSLMRKNMTKEEYKNYVRDTVRGFAKEQKELDEKKLIITRIKRNNKKKYEEYYKKLGSAYANMYIEAIRLLKELPFDADWEEHYQSLKNKE
jgi:hypothetical protein